MVAKITVPRSIRAALNYNEQKVKKGKAACLLASGFLKEAKDLNFGEKLARLERLIQLNKRAATNTVHISLNFAEGEKLPEEKLREIAALYMEKIGFSNQPFLVYEHMDSGHPHLHIVTTNIQRDGSRISLHNLGRNASQKACKALEIQFDLVRAGEKKKERVRQAAPLPTPKAVYGKISTRQAITNVLDAVLPHYKYASLPELYAILNRYGVLADRGRENSRIYRHGGLLYHVLDEQGNKVGIPLKASAIYNKPTLRYLERKFTENAVYKQAYKKGLQKTIDWVMLKPPNNLAALDKALQTENVTLIARQNENGFVYGLTYVDHRSKCVFNGSDLGKAYSARAVLEKCGITQAPLENKKMDIRPAHTRCVAPSDNSESKPNKVTALVLLAQIMKAEQQVEYIPYDFRKKRKQRKL